MLVVDVDWLHGTLRAGSASDTALTGEVDVGEWPPSPARLFAAFVNADGTGDRCRVTDGSELLVLESAPPPDIIADSSDDVVRTPLRERFVVGDAKADPKSLSTGKGRHDYPSRISTLVRPGTLLVPRHPCVSYRYNVVVNDDVLQALRRRAARISYLGAADHPARVMVSVVDVEESEGSAWTADPCGDHVLGVPDEGLLERLDHAFDRFSAGDPVRRSWIPTASARYRAPGDDPPAPPPQLVWLRLQQSLAPERLLDLTETLRAAVLSHLGDDAPPLLHGHMAEGVDGPWMPARYLAFPDVGHRYADGRLHAAAVWLPPMTPSETTVLVRRAVAHIKTLHRPGAFDVPVTPHDGASGIQAIKTSRWRGPARRWVSATPVVFERHGSADLEEVQNWFAHADLPRPEAAKLLRDPFSPGGIRLRPAHLRHRFTTRYAHLEVTFKAPVDARGPMAVGRGRQFGLGLMVPVNDRRAVDT